MKWRTTEPPKVGELLLNIGLPWAVHAIWNEHEQQYIYNVLQVNMIDGKYNDPYWENEYCGIDEVKSWMEVADCETDKG